MRYLLDTHVLLWWIADSKRLTPQMRAIVKHISAENPIYLSDISLWEIAMLVGLGRVRLDRPLREWLELASAPPLVQVERITPAIAAATAELPESFHRDPADRVIVATAKLLGATLVTADKLIAKSGLVGCVGCVG